MTMMRMARTPQVRTLFGQRCISWQNETQVSCVFWQGGKLTAVWGSVSGSIASVELGK